MSPNSCDNTLIFDQLASFNQGSQMFKHLINISITTLIWHIWSGTNSRIFNGIQMPKDVRSLLIIQDCKDLLTHSKITTHHLKGEELILRNLVSRLTKIPMG